MMDNFDATLLSSEQYDILRDENDTSEESNGFKDEILELSLSLTGVSLSESYSCVSTLILGVQLTATILCEISKEGLSIEVGTASVEISSTQGC